MELKTFLSALSFQITAICICLLFATGVWCFGRLWGSVFAIGVFVLIAKTQEAHDDGKLG